jgi:hypothetical protein
MNNTKLKFSIQGGGLFSRLLQCAIIPLADIEFENVYLTAHPLQTEDQVEDHVKPGIRIVTQTQKLLNEHGVNDPWDNVFNFILEQDSVECLDQGLLPVGKFYSSYDPIERSPRFNDYRQVYSKIKIKSQHITQSKYILQDQNNVLGVHVRVKDANSVKNPASFQDYVDAIDFNLKNYSYSKIFVAADNSISIKKLEERYPGMILYNQLERSDNESADSFIWEYQNCFRYHYWTNSLIDCLSLSQCNSLICKESNFSNAAILIGNYKNIHRIHSPL